MSFANDVHLQSHSKAKKDLDSSASITNTVDEFKEKFDKLWHNRSIYLL